MPKHPYFRSALYFSRNQRYGLLGVALCILAVNYAERYKRDWYANPLKAEPICQLFAFLEKFPTEAIAKKEVSNVSYSFRSKDSEKEKWTQKPWEKVNEDYDKSKPLSQSILINRVDSAGLIEVKGIGPKSARRILRFRNALGGFVDSSQFNEVYGLHPNVLDRLLQIAVIENNTHDRINLDTASIRTLSAHPYISWKLAKVIVNYREQHNGFKRVEDLRAIHLINDSIFERINPYLYVGK